MWCCGFQHPKRTNYAYMRIKRNEKSKKINTLKLNKNVRCPVCTTPQFLSVEFTTTMNSVRHLKNKCSFCHHVFFHSLDHYIGMFSKHEILICIDRLLQSNRFSNRMRYGKFKGYTFFYVMTKNKPLLDYYKLNIEKTKNPDAHSLIEYVSKVENVYSKLIELCQS